MSHSSDAFNVCQYPPEKARSALSRQKQSAARSLGMLVVYALPVSGKLANSKIGDVGSAGAPPASLAGTASSSDASSRGRSRRPGVAAAALPPPPGRRGRGEEGQCGTVFWLDAVGTTFLLEVEQAACTKSPISMCAERPIGG